VLRPVARPIPTQNNINTKKTRPDIYIETTIQIFERAKTFHALDGAAMWLSVLIVDY
jgi:hypothetical protein